MNFMPATLTNGSVHLPMADVPLPQEVHDRLGRQPEGRHVIAGIRPEDFEDATKVDGDGRARGTTFKAKLDLVEAMGAEFYAHFGIKGQMVQSEELQDLRADAGGVEELTESGETRAGRPAQSREPGAIRRGGRDLARRIEDALLRRAVGRGAHLRALTSSGPGGWLRRSPSSVRARRSSRGT